MASPAARDPSAQGRRDRGLPVKPWISRTPIVPEPPEKGSAPSRRPAVVVTRTIVGAVGRFGGPLGATVLPRRVKGAQVVLYTLFKYLLFRPVCTIAFRPWVE